MTRGPLIFAAVSVVTLAAQQPPAQPAPSATGLIVGQVVDADSGQPVGETVVTLMAASSGPVNPLNAIATAQKLVTDANGRFVYYQLPKGRYSINTTKPGYLTGVYGKFVPRGSGSQLDLADGEKITDVRILIWKHAAITGRVVDEAGEPVVAAEIRVRRVTMVNGRPGYQAILSNAVLTDDRGMYRVPSLEPGSYVVGVAATSTTIPAPMIGDYVRATGTARAEMQQALFAAAPSMSSSGSAANQTIGDHILQVANRMPTPPEPRPGESPAVYTAVYFPQTALVTEATPIRLKGGETRSGIDFSIRPTATMRVSGQLQGPEGAVGIATLFLMPANADGPVGTTTEAIATTVSDARGAFTFLGVPSGTYSLFVMKWPLTSGPSSSQVTMVQGAGGSSARGVVSEGTTEIKPAFWAQQPLTVGGNPITDLAIAMRPGIRVTGRLVFEASGGAQPPPNQRFTGFLEPSALWLRSLSLAETNVGADGNFTLSGVPEGRYILTVMAPSGWYVKSAVAGGRDLVNLPFDLREDLTDAVVTVSNRSARIAGAVHDRDGKPDAGAAAIIFPADPRYWVDFGSNARRIRDGRAGRDGSFTLSDLPAGEYLIAAVPQASLDWSSPNFFERLSQVATKVTLLEGEQRTIDLQTAQVR